MRKHSAQLATLTLHLPHLLYSPHHCLASSVEGLLTLRRTARRRRKRQRRQRETLHCGKQKGEVAGAREASRLPRRQLRRIMGTVQRWSLLAKQVPFHPLIEPHGSRLEQPLTGIQTQ